MAKEQRNALAWGIILLVIGFLFLLDNFDIDVWDVVARLWPLALIIWGAWKLYFGLRGKNEGPAPKPDREEQ